MEKELLYRFFSGEATTDQEKQVLDWLDADPAHHRELLAERRLFDAMLMHSQAASARKRPMFVLPRWTREAIKYAAVIAVVLLAGTGYLSYRNEQLLAAFNTITVPAGQHVDVTLPDGTKVCLNARSELRYPTFFAGKTRKVQLSGEAFFDVTHDKARPFIVETAHCGVEVLGTRFDVEARAGSGEFSVALVEGSVKVSQNDDPANAVTLRPKEQVAYNDGRFEVSRIPEGENFLWRDGLIAFRDATFSDLLGKFETYYGVKIEIRRRQLPATVFTGKIRISEGIDHALWVLQQSADFTYGRNESKDTIYIQ